jgi:hypothetical protein
MVRRTIPIAGLICLMGMLSSQPAAAQLNSTTIDRVAIYAASEANRSNLPESSVTYNVTNPATIDSIFSGIDFATQRDCRGMDAENSSYIYVKFKTSSRKVYHLFLQNTHIAVAGRRDMCYFVPPAVRSIIAAHTQP